MFRQRCTVCHTAEAGDDGGAQGPSLGGVFGRPAASAPQFSYTQALRDSKLTWDAATLRRFLGAPTSVVPGTSMAFAGISKGADRADLIAYLNTLADNPAPLPTAPAQSAAPKEPDTQATAPKDEPKTAPVPAAPAPAPKH